jgi:hypothetical protein
LCNFIAECTIYSINLLATWEACPANSSVVTLKTLWQTDSDQLRRSIMGEQSKKDKNKLQKQKAEELKKKEDQKKNKLPKKTP